VYRMRIGPETAAPVVREEKAGPRRWQKAALAAVALLVVVAGVWAIWNFYFRPAFEPASVERMAFPLPDKPSIAVLPFVNMSEDPKQEYFSDGLTDQIISGLSKVPNLFVIARNSTFTYKGKPMKIQKVAEDLGVKYVLEGSVQKTTDRIRITTQLIDATTGHHLWSERYDREPKDIFSIQDDITMEIMKAMRVELRGDQARMWVKHEKTNLKVYEKYLEGLSFYRKFTKGDNAQARQLFEQAIDKDPQFVVAYVTLGWTHFWDARFGWVESRAESIKMALKYAQKATELADTAALAYSLIGGVYFLQRQYEKAMAEGERAAALNPNGAMEYSFLAGVAGCSGRWEDSIIYAKKSIRLDPFAQIVSFHWLGRAYFMTGQYDEAIQTFKKALGDSPNYLPAHAFLAASYISLGRESEAAAAAREVLRINPKFCLESYAKTLPYKNKSDIERYLAALRKAGLPQTPPLLLPDKPSIAVLPFVNMSGDPEQEYFSDGITDELTTMLSKVPDLFVISRTSAFAYKNKPVKVKQVAEELGVRYVLEGSVQRSGNRVRVIAQLIDAVAGNHLWAEQYDRDLKDIFELQDNLTIKIITALRVKLTAGEDAKRLTGGRTENLQYIEKKFEGIFYVRQFNKESNAKAKQIFKELINMEPKLFNAYAGLALANIMDVWLGSSSSPRESLREAIKLCKKAIELDESQDVPHSLLGHIYAVMRQYDKAIEEGQRAVAINPNSADARLWLGMSLTYAGWSEEAIDSIKKALRLSPFSPPGFIRGLGIAYREAGRYGEAITEFKKCIKRLPDDIVAYRALALTYALDGQYEEARETWSEVLKIDPEYSAEKYLKVWPFKNPDSHTRALTAMNKTGIK
jgi:adenylate cyclase